MTPRYVVAALITAAFIIYGSLSPFDFHAGGPGDPISHLVAHWHTPGQSGTGFIANVMLYLPLGLFIALALAPQGRPRWQALWAALTSIALCVAVELIQFYDRGRTSTLTDVYLNVAGGLLGALVVLRLPRRWRRPVGDLRQPVVLILLAAFAVIELYPFVPTLNVTWYADAVSSLWRHPHIAPLALVRSIGRWLLAGVLIGHLIGARQSRGVLVGAMLGVFVGQIVMLNIWLSSAEWLGAVVAAVLWWILVSRSPHLRLGVPAAVLALPLLIAPFAAGQGAADGNWLPFIDLPGHSWPVAIQHVITRLYSVGGLIWLIGRLGRNELGAGIAVCALLTAAVVIAVLTDAGAPSTTNATLALIVGVVFRLLPERDAASD